MALKKYKSFPLLDDYLSYLVIIKGRSENTIIEYRTDLLMFFDYVNRNRNPNAEKYSLSHVDKEYISTVTMAEMYGFIAESKTMKKASAGTRARKIVSIRQFWKYLKSKAHAIDTNIAEELETPKIPKRVPKYLNLEESVRLLIASEYSPRNRCIITLFLNCALRLSELTSIDIDQVTKDTLNIVGKGDKERTIYLTPATKSAITQWIEVRNSIETPSQALFITKFGTRMSNRSVQDVVKRCLERANLEHKQLSTHKLRHTAATLMYQYGHVDIRSLQQILGHESIATTQIYTHVDQEQLRSAVNSNPLAGMFGGVQ